MLTQAQGTLLLRAKEASYDDESGPGAIIHDRVQLRVYERLQAKGFLSIGLPRGHYPLGSARITPTGRIEIAKFKKKEDAVLLNANRCEPRCEYGHDDPWNGDNYD